MWERVQPLLLPALPRCFSPLGLMLKLGGRLALELSVNAYS